MARVSVLAELLGLPRCFPLEQRNCMAGNGSFAYFSPWAEDPQRIQNRWKATAWSKMQALMLTYK